MKRTLRDSEGPKGDDGVTQCDLCLSPASRGVQWRFSKINSDMNDSTYRAAMTVSLQIHFIYIMELVIESML